MAVTTLTRTDVVEVAPNPSSSSSSSSSSSYYYFPTFYPLFLLPWLLLRVLVLLYWGTRSLTLVKYCVAAKVDGWQAFNSYQPIATCMRQNLS